jgi:hypothetical protein
MTACKIQSINQSINQGSSGKDVLDDLLEDEVGKIQFLRRIAGP